MAEFFNQFPKIEKNKADLPKDPAYLNIDNFLNELKNNLSEGEQLSKKSILFEKKENEWIAEIPVLDKEGKTKYIYAFKNKSPGDPDKWEMTIFDDFPQLKKYIKRESEDRRWN